jgi:riboflavin biosynthesis pyrimidine reductase
MKKRSVCVDIRSDVLRSVLVDRMKEFPGLATGCSEPLDVVLSTTADCTAKECATLTKGGAEVVIFATVPNDEQRREYEDSGARYVPMSGSSAELVALLDALQIAG